MRGWGVFLALLLVAGAVALSGCAEKKQDDTAAAPTDEPAPTSGRTSRRGAQNRSETTSDELPEGKIESPSGFEWRSKALAGGDLFLQFTIENQGSKDCEGELATAGQGPTQGPHYISVGTNEDGTYNGGWTASGGRSAVRVAAADAVDTTEILGGDGSWYGRFQFTVEPGETTRFTFMTRDLVAAMNEYTDGDAFVFEVSCGGPSAVSDIKAGRNVHLFDESNMQGGVIVHETSDAAASIQATTEADLRDAEVLTFFGASNYNAGQFTFDHPSGQDAFLLLPQGPGLFALTDGPGHYAGTLDKISTIFVYTWGAWAGVHDITTLAELEAIPVA